VDGHYCNGIVDPGVCCPLGHGETDERFCTCKVSPEMRDAVRAFHHELYLETYRQFVKEDSKWVLRNHRTEWIDKTWDGKPLESGPYMRVDCRLGGALCQVEEGNICGRCHQKIDWDPDAFRYEVPKLLAGVVQLQNIALPTRRLRGQDPPPAPFSPDNGQTHSWLSRYSATFVTSYPAGSIPVECSSLRGVF
jgi:hypothetical protein